MPHNDREESPGAPSRALNVALWSAQILLAFIFVGTATWKAATPISVIAEMIPWAGDVSPATFYATATLDLLGGIGILAPSLSRIWPRLTLLAAMGCATLQLGAIVFHVMRDEVVNTPFNFFLVALSAFVFYGRRDGVAPIRTRQPPRGG